MLERIFKKSLGSYLGRVVFQRLGLTRTTTPKLANVYVALDDASPYELPSPILFKDGFFEAAAGVYSSLNDMLRFAQAIMGAKSSAFKTSASPIEEPKMYLTQHILGLGPALRERSYDLGWIKTQLPRVTGVIGRHRRLYNLDEIPTMGRGSSSRLAMYHRGATVGFFSSVYLFPESESAIIVLINSIALGDATDWIAQAYTQTLFEGKEQLD